MSAATVLQSAANRFSRVAGFSPISVDGNIGPVTLSAVQRSLDYIAIVHDDAVSEPLSDQAAAWAAGARTQSGLVATAVGVGNFLNFAADALKLPFVAAPAPTPRPTIDVSTLLPTVGPNPSAASLVDAWRALATWKKILLGALAGVGVIWLWGRYKGSRGLGGTKLYLFTYRNKHNSWSDVWATDVEHAREQIKRRKNASGFYEISRVRNVPAREVA